MNYVVGGYQDDKGNAFKFTAKYWNFAITSSKQRV